MTKAILLQHNKKIYADGCIEEIVIWKLPVKTVDFPEGIKYRLHYGHKDGTCIIRYDNKKGKGHHIHYLEEEEPYIFTILTQLLADFLKDVQRTRENKL